VRDATDGEFVGGVGVTDAERASPRRESSEVILDGEEVGGATRELRGDADDRETEIRGQKL
jgi:hypothetical protein